MNIVNNHNQNKMKEKIHYIKDGKEVPIDENNIQDCEGLTIEGVYTKEEVKKIFPYLNL